MTATIALSGAALAKAGERVSGAFTATWGATSEWEGWLEEAEAYLCALVKYDLVTNWASLNAVYKLLFTEYVSSYCAVQLIKYNILWNQK